MMKKNQLWLWLLMLPLIGCAQQKGVNYSNNTNSFYIYNFGGLQDKSPQEQISILKKSGYDGINLRMAKEKNVSQLLEFIEIADNTPNFKIFSVFVRYNFNDSEEDKKRWKAVVDIIENKGIDLWVIFGKVRPNVTDSVVEGILKNIVLYSASKKVSVLLYPHSHCYFYSAEQSLPMVKKINHPNLKIIVHTCHELKAKNGGRLYAVVNNVKEYLGAVTISGATAELDTTTKITMNDSTILPLEDSVYDFGPFLKALKEINYKGPVGYINFGFDKKPEQYLIKSLEEWKRLKDNYLNY